MAALPWPRTIASSICRSCRHRLAGTATLRSFATTSIRRADPPPTSTDASSNVSSPSTPSARQSVSELLQPRPQQTTVPDLAAMDELLGTDMFPDQNQPSRHRLCVYSHKHNTHMTLVQPPRLASQTMGSGVSATSSKAADQNKMVDTLLSLSTGNIGFRKSGRGAYDAAYQLAGFVFKQIKERGLMRDLHELEIVYRGFGQGREAVTKALMGAEGKYLRSKITYVVDATRVKHGGTRGRKPRRLG